jgi:site-specific recombinase XerD
MNERLEPSQPAIPKQNGFKRKKKDFEPKPVRIRGKVLYQIYAGSKLVERNGKMMRVLDRRTYANKNEAESAADLLRIRKINFGTAALSISERLRSDAIEAQRLLEPHRVSLLEAVRSFVANLEALKKSREIPAAVDDYIAGAKSDGRSPRYIGDLRHRLGRFSRDFADRTLASVTTTDLENWLRSLGVGTVSRNSYRRRLGSLFSYSVDRGWCSNNPASKVTIARERETSIGILSPDEFSQLLENAGEQTLPYWLLGGFAGIRSAEIERLTWKDIHFESGLIEISGDKSKTAAKRFIPIQPVLEAWLAPYEDRHGSICPANLRKLLKADRLHAGIMAWPSNALRHSFASYHLAHFQDAAKLALELGHTNSHVVFRHYRELVKPQEAKRWWNIMPTGASNIVALSA